MSAFRSPLRDTARRLAAAFLWVALLGGVFAMHGLSTHGVMGSAEASLAALGHGTGVNHDAG